VALSRFVIGTACTLPAGTPTAAANGFGSADFAIGTGATSQWPSGQPVTMTPTFVAGQVIYADSATPGSTPTGAQQLYQALVTAGANLFAFRDGTDAVGHAATSN